MGFSSGRQARRQAPVSQCTGAARNSTREEWLRSPRKSLASPPPDGHNAYRSAAGIASSLRIGEHRHEARRPPPDCGCPDVRRRPRPRRRGHPSGQSSRPVARRHRPRLRLGRRHLDGAHGRRRRAAIDHHPARDREPCFSPDGKQLAFISERSGAPRSTSCPPRAASRGNSPTTPPAARCKRGVPTAGVCSLTPPRSLLAPCRTLLHHQRRPAPGRAPAVR